MYKKPDRVKPVLNEQNTFTVVQSLIENPHVSSRVLSRELDISQSSILRITRENKFHPYHIQLLQELEANDFNIRRGFCEWAINKVQEEQDFFKYVLFSDEATFHKNGNLNRHNFHYYDTENPHFTRNVDHQHRWSLNVWGGIVGEYVVGPYFFDGILNGNIYLHFLRNSLPDLLENIHLATIRRLWIQHDGAPAHYSAQVRYFLNNEYPNQWIGRGGPIHWPPGLQT
jgi:hypothetical protein